MGAAPGVKTVKRRRDSSFCRVGSQAQRIAAVLPNDLGRDIITLAFA